MGVGINVSRTGYDVNTASDKQLAFSSQWPLLPIEAEGKFEVNNTLTAPVTIYNHDLGYPPVFRIYYQSDFYDSSYYYPDGDPNRIGSRCGVNSTDLVWNDVWYSDTPMYVYWKVYRRNLTQNQSTASVNLADEAKGNSGGYGFLISKNGKSVTSGDLRDFNLRSDMRPLIVDSSKFTTVPGYSINITHNLGYLPMYWVYYYESDSGLWYKVRQNDVFSGSVTVTDITFAVNSGLWGGASNFAIILFKSTINTDG